MSGTFYLVLGLVYAGLLLVKAVEATGGNLPEALATSLFPLVALVLGMPLMGAFISLVFGILGA